jgi:hypothetical protein
MPACELSPLTFSPTSHTSTNLCVYEVLNRRLTGPSRVLFFDLILLGLWSLSVMDSFTGPPGYWDYNPLLYPYHSCEYLPPIFDLEFGPFGAAPVPRNQSRRSRTEQKPYAEESDIIFKGRRLWTYYLEKVPYAMEKPTNEDFNETYRQTFDGRTLKYTLTVLQQPERARACGAGARCESLLLAVTCSSLPSPAANLAQLQPTAVLWTLLL